MDGSIGKHPGASQDNVSGETHDLGAIKRLEVGTPTRLVSTAEDWYDLEKTPRPSPFSTSSISRQAFISPQISIAATLRWVQLSVDQIVSQT